MFDDSIEISEILESFDLSEIRKMIQEQLSALNVDPCDIVVDNFRILYQTFASVNKKRDEVPEEEFDEVEDRFFKVCEIFIEEICLKFGITLNDEYIESHYRDLPALCLALYAFFFLEFKSNLYTVLRNFIKKNQTDIALAFENAKNKKDASTLANKSIEDESVALIVSNIYDVVEWAMDQMDSDMFMDLVDNTIAYKAIEPLYNAGILAGNFVDAICDIMKENISLKGRICFDLICNLKGIEI